LSSNRKKITRDRGVNHKSLVLTQKIASDKGVVVGQAKKVSPAAHQKTNINSQKIASDQGLGEGGGNYRGSSVMVIIEYTRLWICGNCPRFEKLMYTTLA
jgi:hypothetical protein